MEVKLFGAAWCGPCKAFKPKFEAIAKAATNGHYYEVLDVDDHPDQAAKFKVRGVPTLVLVENGAELARASGSAEIQKLLDTL